MRETGMRLQQQRLFSFSLSNREGCDMNYIVVGLLLLAIFIAIWHSRHLTIAALRTDDVNAFKHYIERRERILKSPFFADVMCGAAHSYFLKAVEDSRVHHYGETRAFTHISLVKGWPGEYVINYFGHDRHLLDEYQSAVTACQIENSRRRLLADLMCSLDAAESQIFRQGTEFIDAFLSRLNFLEFDPIGECPSYEFKISVEDLDMNVPLLLDKPSRKGGFPAMIHERKKIFTLILASIILAMLAGLCIHFSDSFYYPGIAHYRTYSDLFGAFPAAPTHKWPIVFSMGAFIFGTAFALSIMLIVRRGQNPIEKWRQSKYLVLRYCSFPVLTGGILLLHYTLCDFVGDRWFVLNQMFNTDFFSLLKKVYFYLHETTPFLFCFAALWYAVSHTCLSKRLWKITSSGVFLTFSICGVFFLIFDLWFQQWAILPLVGCIIWAIMLHVIWFRTIKNQAHKGNS